MSIRLHAASLPCVLTIGPVILAIWACAPPAPAAAPVAEAPPAPAAAPAEALPALPALTRQEHALADRLRRHVEALAVEIGERPVEQAFSLAAATDYLATTLEKMGFEVRRMGYRVGDDVLQNIEVVVPGGKRGQEHVVVGAHFDTHPGSPGADDNASGVAATLALAERFREEPTARTLRFVCFASEEAPRFGTLEMGSLAYAKQLVKEDVRVVSMLSLESIGFFSDAPGSQRYPTELEGAYPKTGNFVAVVGNTRSEKLVDQVTNTLSAHTPLPVIGGAFSEAIAGIAASDHWAFWQIGVPAVMITDTAPYRNPHYHAPSDLPDTLDFARFARVVAALEHVVRRLGGRTAPAPVEADPAAATGS